MEEVILSSGISWGFESIPAFSEKFYETFLFMHGCWSFSKKSIFARFRRVFNVSKEETNNSTYIVLGKLWPFSTIRLKSSGRQNVRQSFYSLDFDAYTYKYVRVNLDWASFLSQLG